MFQFPGWNSGRLCPAERGGQRPYRDVSIPRLEFWPFVRHLHGRDDRDYPRVSIPRLEFWPFVPLIGERFGGKLRVSIPRLEFWPFVRKFWTSLR